jgi:hypothetical protein
MKDMIAAGLLLTVGIAGCASALEPAGQGQAGPHPSEQLERPMNPTLESVTESVLEDAAARTGIARANLRVESAIGVTWPDGSLGCPQPGMNYTMALVPGYRIKVRAGEQVLDYHASRRGYYVLCPAGMAVEPVVDESM